MRYVLLLVLLVSASVCKVWHSAPWQQPWNSLPPAVQPEYPAPPELRSAAEFAVQQQQQLAASQAAQRGAKSGMRIGFLNLCNYLNPQSGSKAKQAAQREQLAAYIAKCQLQVLVVCELGDRQQLAELQQLLRRQGCDYAYSHVLRVPNELRNLGILSKWAFENHSREHVPIKTAQGAELMRRGILHVRFAATPLPFDLLAVHFKSKFDGEQKTAATRLAEAQALLEYLKRLSSRPLLLVGDFNDGPGSQVWDVLQQGARGDLQALRPLDGQGQAWTHHFAAQDSYARIDALWLNRELSARLKGAFSCGIAAQTQASDHRLLWLEW